MGRTTSERRATGHTAELYVRSLAPREAHQRQERTIERLSGLDERGAIDGFDVLVWGRQLCPDSRSARTDVGRTVADRLDRIDTWAEGTDRSVAGYCHAEQFRSIITGESREIVRLPSLALAEFEGDDLVHFAPCRDGDRAVSVSDRLADLERDEEAGGRKNDPSSRDPTTDYADLR